MHTGITSDDGEDGAASTAAGPSKVIPFSRRAPPQLGSAAADDPLSSAASIGALVNAVVLRLSNKRIRIRVERHGQREKDDRGAR